MHSKDVGHSFYVRELRCSRILFPDWMSLCISRRRRSASTNRLYQLCGLGHYNMKAYLEVLSQQDFDDWMKKETAMQ